METKTPAEMKHALECCVKNGQACSSCAYRSYIATCMEEAMLDAFDYVDQLETRLAQAEKERDALANERNHV